ncbi:TonB-dependent receptor [Gramella jeungdoensis]|uniref:TonB-dependent receptor n=2 Tax=Flavobacteriaceae TaxID=49546 RepID=A0A4Y8ASH9_9FLAO|nr:TonB-dependent receptor [Gramella jeungdoensis]GGK40160.1 TonB-dependent receptor [Lutibacter litoralis]
MVIVLLTQLTQANENGIIKGIVSSGSETILGASIYMKNTKIGTSTDRNGTYSFEVEAGNFVVVVSAVGYKSKEVRIKLKKHEEKILNFELEEDVFGLDQVVVTGTKTFKRRTDSPVIVGIIDSNMLTNVQACNLSEGLKFQPGLRVETDCQTCNYTQLRMNGLTGGYSQILINGRPVFSPLTGLYGLEQIPANMIERIEVVRGGGSALYGSSAIGGTVNVITKIPKESGYNLEYTYQNIDKGTSDNIFNGNGTILTHKGNAGATFFVSKRERDYYDNNGDNFSELPKLKNNSFGVNLFFLPTENQKIELSLSSMNEYRYGGEMVDKEPYLTLQSEERIHDVFIGSLDYQINFNNDNSSFISYFSGQKTARDHYTGIFPDSDEDIQNHIENPPYGISEVSTVQGGMQLNHRLEKFIKGVNVITTGTEYVVDKVYDEIEAYNYLINQKTTNLGVFFQSDWEITPSINLLTGVRADKHNLLNKFIFNPRASFLYKMKESTQFRLTWGTGFRAPQAFDADLHIAFAGGGVSRISLSPDLKEERSTSISGSVNYDKALEKFISGFTLEGFYTYLKDAFYQHPLGEDDLGELFEKRNGDGATVKGVTLELRANYDKRIQLETGLTIQSSTYDTAVSYSDALAPTRNFLRSPDVYGFATLSITPNKKFKTSVNLVYTGAMDLVHLAGAPEQLADAYLKSPTFTELSFKTGYTFNLNELDTSFELFGGVKNVLNEYQEDFDSGKNRDSNYIYGPGAPRTVFIGVKLNSI